MQDDVACPWNCRHDTESCGYHIQQLALIAESANRQARINQVSAGKAAFAVANIHHGNHLAALQLASRDIQTDRENQLKRLQGFTDDYPGRYLEKQRQTMQQAAAAHQYNIQHLAGFVAAKNEARANRALPSGFLNELQDTVPLSSWRPSPRKIPVNPQETHFSASAHSSPLSSPVSSPPAGSTYSAPLSPSPSPLANAEHRHVCTGCGVQKDNADQLYQHRIGEPLAHMREEHGVDLRHYCVGRLVETYVSKNKAQLSRTAANLSQIQCGHCKTQVPIGTRNGKVTQHYRDPDNVECLKHVHDTVGYGNPNHLQGVPIDHQASHIKADSASSRSWPPCKACGATFAGAVPSKKHLNSEAISVSIPELEEHAKPGNVTNTCLFVLSRYYNWDNRVTNYERVKGKSPAQTKCPRCLNRVATGSFYVDFIKHLVSNQDCMAFGLLKYCPGRNLDLWNTYLTRTHKHDTDLQWEGGVGGRSAPYRS